MWKCFDQDSRLYGGILLWQSGFFNGCQLQLLDWHIHLDKSLPGPLGVIGAWLHRAEMALREDIPIQHAHDETANVLHRKLEQHKVTACLWISVYLGTHHAINMVFT